MSLAYTLDLEDIPNFFSWFAANLIGLPDNQAAFPTLSRRFTGPYDPANPGDEEVKGINPTGEYIIRDYIQTNGNYIIVGSYKAFFLDLYGSGDDDYAWDGFILYLRGYNMSAPGEPPANGIGQGVWNADNALFIPMRMPYETDPGVIGDAAAIAADSSVGLHAVDIYKDYADVTIGAALGDENIRIVTCGFSRINPATYASAKTGMDYVGCYWVGVPFFTVYGDTNPPTGVMNPEDGRAYPYYEPILAGNPTATNVAGLIQVSWNGRSDTVTDWGQSKTDPQGRFQQYKDLEIGIAIGENFGANPYDYRFWFDGTQPDGTVATGAPGAPGPDLSLPAFNYWPRRFLSISCISQSSYAGVGNTPQSLFYIGGDCSIDTNDGGSIDDTCAMVMGCALEYPLVFLKTMNSLGYYAEMAPYAICFPSIATSLTPVGAVSWLRTGAITPLYDFSDTYVVGISSPYEVQGFADYTTPFEETPSTYFAVNGFDIAGDEKAGIFFTPLPLAFPNSQLFPLADPGGAAFTMETGIDVPTRYYGRAVQQRTFTIDEEGNAKDTKINLDTGEETSTVYSVYDTDTSQWVGWKGNYQRYGIATTLEEFIVTEGSLVIAGTLSRNGYGFLGHLDTVGPKAIMWDSDSQAATFNGTDLTTTLVVKAEGANLNANHLTDPTSTSRIVTGAGWDNDRDQWLFCTSDSGGFGLISVAANFDTASNNLGFLDQTQVVLDKMGTGVATHTDCLYMPMAMSNALDGYLFVGDRDTDTNVVWGLKPKSGTTDTKTRERIDASTYTYDVDYTRMYGFRIAGTTGRTARVWVDYINFDGADALIASKLRERGIKVSIESVEWFKRKIIQSGDLNIKQEEIEEWMRAQQDEFKQMIKDAERQGRVRRRKKQVSGFEHDMEEIINPDFIDDEVKDFLGDFTPETRPPTPEEERIEKKKKGGYSPESKSYYDEVFED